MSDFTATFWQIDFAPLLVSVLAALSCALLGSYLVLRRQALMGDALSHAVLPGLAAGFIIAGSVAAFPMMAGAFGACLLAVGMIGALKKYARLEPGLAMGIVFTTLFALGVVLLEQKVGRGVHLDAKHALYGALEFVYWPEISQARDLLTPENWAALPRQIAVLLGFNAVLITIITLFFKELTLLSFDPLMARSSGLPADLMNTGFMALVAIAAVAAFEAVGSILVIALLICPAATARMLCDDMRSQLLLSAGFAVLSALCGYALASLLPHALGFDNAWSAAAMITVVAGFFQILAMLFAPLYGALRKA